MIIVWLCIAAATVIALIGLAVFLYRRIGAEAALHVLTPLGLVFVGSCLTWAVLSDATRRDREADRRDIDARVVDLVTRATMPGTALACLDAIAGETVEASCERAVFSSPEATAAAVSYVSAQLTLLTDLTEYVRRIGGREPAAFASLRRSIEGDRFGIVAHVLAFRDGCTADDCPPLALLKQTGRVVANLNESAYDLYVARYSDKWPAVTRDPVVGAAHPGEPDGDEPGQSAGKSPEAAKGEIARPAGGVGGPLVYPSADSIPAVSIMNAEPALATPPAATGGTQKQSAPKRAPPAAPQRKSTTQQKSSAPAPVDLNPNADGQ